MSTPTPPSLPPELIDALRQRNVPQLLKVLLSQRPAASSPPAAPARPPAARPAPGAGKRPPEAELPQVAAEGLSPGEVPRTGTTFWGWLMAALLAYLAYRLWGG